MKTSRWAFLSKFDILDDFTGELYLRRWRIIQTPWFSIYLHKIASPDKDRDLHDHPWSFVSMVLRGGYDESLMTGHATVGENDWMKASHVYSMTPKRRGWLSIAFRKATDAHRIVRLFKAPTWTLVLTGPRRRSWGFYTSKGYVDWREYLGLPPESGS